MKRAASSGISLCLFLTVFFGLAMLVMSCGGRNTTEEVAFEDPGTYTYIYKDSCQQLTLSLSLELPLGKDSVSLQIRDSLIADFVRSVSQPGYSEDDAPIKPFEGDVDKPQTLVDYYGRAVYDRLLRIARSEYEERISYLDEDTTMTSEEKEMVKSDMPVWAFELSVKQTIDTPRFVVYDSEIYCYYGGAHGGVIGGSMTFDKTTGSKIDSFVKADAVGAMQKLLRKGLIKYYSEVGDTITDAQLSERLQIEGTMIPLPQRTPCLNASADTLVFTYGQYEIACYADGMPSFGIAVKDLTPYLTPEAQKLIIVPTL